MRAQIIIVLWALWPFAVAGETLTVAGQERHYDLVLPAKNQGLLPLVILLHGGGGDPAAIAKGSKLADYAEQRGLAAAFSAGYDGHWNDGRQDFDSKAHELGIDDVAFLTELVRDLAAGGPIDPRQVYLAGVSNGGMMALRILCERSDLFAGFGVVAAGLPTAISEGCQVSHPAPLLVMNGTDDPIVPFDGGAVGLRKEKPRGIVLGVEEMLALFAANYGCAGRQEIFIEDTALGDEVTPLLFSYQGCAAPIRFFRLEGGGHGWPGSGRQAPELFVSKVPETPDATAEILRFFGLLP